METKLNEASSSPSAPIRQFQAVYSEEFGERISAENALIQMNKLVTFFKTIANYIEIKEGKNEKE